MAASPSTLHTKLSMIADVTGVDISGDAVEEYRRTGICNNIIIGDVEKLGLLELRPEFDLVVVGDLIEHYQIQGICSTGLGLFVARIQK